MKGNRGAEEVLEVIAYSDANFAADKTDRKSVTGGLVTLDGISVCWVSKKQGGVALSNMEAEYTAASVMAAELLGIRELLGELGVKHEEPMPLRVDNQAALKQLDGETASAKAKHIDIRIKFVGYYTQKGLLKPEYREGVAMPADLMTKALDAPRMADLRGRSAVPDEEECWKLVGKTRDGKHRELRSPGHEDTSYVHSAADLRIRLEQVMSPKKHDHRRGQKALAHQRLRLQLPLPVAARTGMVDDAEELSTAVTHERGDGNDAGAPAPATGATTADLMTLLKGMSEQLVRLEESHAKLKASQNAIYKRLNEDETRFARIKHPHIANAGLFASELGRGSRMHIDLLEAPPRTPPAAALRRPTVSPQYFEQRQPDYIRPSHLQRLYEAECAAAQTPAPPVPPQAEQAQADLGGFQQQQGVRYPDARQNKLAIRPFNGKELYVGLGSGFLEWGRRFERQAILGQSACGFTWPEDVKIDLLGHYLSGTAEKYYNRQVESWVAQMPTLQYVMERMLETFKTTITPAQAMKLFTTQKDPKRTWPEHYMYLVTISEACGGGADYLVLNNIVQYASLNLRMVLMAKVDGTRTDYLQQAEELAHFAQAWSWSRPRAADIMLAVNEMPDESDETWILDSGSSRHLVNDASCLENPVRCNDRCMQPNGEPLGISVKGSVTLCVTACEVPQTVKLTEVYFSKNVVHNLISYGQLDNKGYLLTVKDGKRVMGNADGKAVFDLHLQRNVFVVKGSVVKKQKPASDVVMAALNKEVNGNGGEQSSVQKGTLVEFHRRLGHLNYDAVERLARDPSSDIELTDRRRVNCLTCAQGKQSKNRQSGKDTGEHSPIDREGA
ncbi:hypothetical protein ON010_g13531 [Phytophthora cinnamomi]|nr:hypothetical protein ON010_g13531 [Phytophthora cinnamomi]